MPYGSPYVDVVQFRLPLWHGMAMVPTVMSLKTQLLAGTMLELQLDADCAAASLYKIKSGLPCRVPVFSSTSASRPAKAGEDADVPPIPTKLNVLQAPDEISASHIM